MAVGSTILFDCSPAVVANFLDFLQESCEIHGSLAEVAEYTTLTGIIEPYLVLSYILQDSWVDVLEVKIIYSIGIAFEQGNRIVI